jgi:putative addiction module killer protein
MIEVRRTAQFIEWLRGLRDTVDRARIAKRIDRMAQGHFGDHKPVGDGVSEMRFAFGPGYRVYFARRGDRVVILLCGGEKDGQERDIACAKQMAKEIA